MVLTKLGQRMIIGDCYLPSILIQENNWRIKEFLIVLNWSDIPQNKLHKIGIPIFNRINTNLNLKSRQNSGRNTIKIFWTRGKVFMKRQFLRQFLQIVRQL